MKKGWIALLVVLILVAWLLPSPLTGMRSEEPKAAAAAYQAREERQQPTERPKSTERPESSVTYIGNRNTGVFHYPTCSSVSQMSEKNKIFYYGDREELIEDGYRPCGRCHP